MGSIGPRTVFLRIVHVIALLIAVTLYMNCRQICWQCTESILFCCIVQRNYCQLKVPWGPMFNPQWTPRVLLRVKQTVFLSEQCAMSKVTTSGRRAVFRPWQLTQAHNCFPLVIALLITRCSKSAQKFAARVRQVTTVAVVTTQLVLNQFNYFFITSIEYWIKSLSTKYNY